MGNNVSMVTYDRLETIKDKNRSSASNMTAMGEVFYESGMIEVLKEVAAAQLGDPRFEVEESPYTREATAKVVEIYESLKVTLTPEQQDILWELEEAQANLRSMETDDLFINGFIHGYAYLKQFTKNRKNPL